MTGGEREARRILAEYRRREREVDAERYAPWNPAEDFMRAGRRRVAARLLRRCGVFPRPGSPVLEVGYGRVGWLGDLIGWGIPAGELCGMELDPERARQAQQALPAADLRVGDARDLPWPAGNFQLVVASTVFSSVLDPAARRQLAGEIVRVLAPGGALLWYDFRWHNPSNRQVRGIGRRQLARLFPGLAGEVRSLTLAPPLCRRAASLSHSLAALLEALPFLRSHLLAVLVKGERSQGEAPP